MADLVLNDEQTNLVVSTLRPLQVRDSRGNVLGVISPIWTENDIAEAKRRINSDEPRYTTAQVLEYLSSLDRK
ncbi:MAG TPA: hypothetical protein VK395_27950 [Gemmataceae bacterium]|nr:hypothetical protein [Gemmataceae bacterium]